MNTTQTQVRSTEEALKLALEALEKHGDAYLGHSDEYQFAITKVKEALAQPELCKYGQEPKSCTSSPMDCQCALDATFEQPEQEEKLPPVEIGVDVTKEGTAVTAFYRRANDVMEIFYSQFHPLAQPEHEPVAWMHPSGGILRRLSTGLERENYTIPLYTIPPQPAQPAVAEQHEQSTTCGEPDLGGVDVFYPKDEHYKTVIKGVQRLFDDKRQLASDAIQKEIDAYKAANPHCDVVAIVGDLAPYRRRTIGLPDSAPLYTTPPTQQSCSQRQCNVKPLTDAQINVIWDSLIARPDYSREMIVRAIEAAHGIKE